MRLRCNVVTCIARVVVVAVVAATIGALCGLQVAAAGVPVGPGVTYFPPAATTNHDASSATTSGAPASADGPQAVRVIRISRDNPYVQLRASLARGQVAGVESVLTQALRQHAPADAPRQTVVAAVNADFFASAPVSGMPIGIHRQGGEIVTSPADRPAFGVRADGRPVIGVPELIATVWRNEAAVGSTYRVGGVSPDEYESLTQADIDAVNRPQQGLTLTLYTPRFGTQTPPVDGTVVTVRGVVEPLHPGIIHTGIVSRTETFQQPTAIARAAIPADGVVFVARGPAQMMLDELNIGEWVHFSVELAPPFADVVDAVAGWPVLLQGGQRQSLPDRDPLVAGRHPRTAIGFNDDELIIVTADGRQPGYARGMNLFELTDLLVSLGATDAINLDGGGSTTMVVRPPGATSPVVANVPSDGYERSVANALLVMSSAPAAALATLHVQPAAPSVLRGATVPVTVLGQDRHNNPVTIHRDSVTWQWDANGRTENPIAVGDADFTFNSASVVPHTARLTATVGRVQGTSTVNIVDTVATLQPAADIVNVTAGETTALTMYAYDETGRRVWVDPQQLQWTVSGGTAATKSTAAIIHNTTVVPGVTTASGPGPAAGSTSTNGYATDAGNAGAMVNSGGAVPVATVDAFGHVTGQIAGKSTVYARLGDAVAATSLFVDKPPLLIADFSTPDARTEWFANVVRAQATLTRVTPPESLRPGRPSLRLAYDLSVSPGGTAAAYLQAARPIPIPERPEAVGVWVYGSGSGHWLRGNYIDGTGTRQVLDFTAVGGLDWTGWRLVTAPVPPDAVLPISLERIYVVEVHRERQSEGELYFDRLVALYESQ